jgi:putative FmdB family regulatory protein
MPLYEYECEACGQRFELIRKFSDPPVDVCALCGKGPVTRLLSSPAIQFKGSGFYITDYAKKSESSKTDGAKGDAGKNEAVKAGGTSESTKSDSASSDFLTKSDSKSDASAKPAAAATPAKSGGSTKD